MNNCFGKAYRLLKTEDFSSVFALRKQRARTHIQVLQSQGNAMGLPRLGLVVSKKVAKRANRRNYMKRVIREWFRQNKQQLPACDFVVRVKKAFHHDEATAARQELGELMLKSLPKAANK